MKAQPLTLRNGEYIECPAHRALYVRLRFPIEFGPLRERILPVQTTGKRDGTPNWTWNGSIDAPTINPSILTNWQAGDGDGNPAPDIVCHSFVNNGMVEFLPDCTHSLAGQTVPLLDVEAIAL
jgi:Family of unknown function (DUF6527)